MTETAGNSGKPTPDEVARCVHRYGRLGKVEQILPLQSGLYHNTVWRIRASKGGFFLKVLSAHPNESTESRYQYIASAMGQVAALGVDVPTPVPNADSLLLTGCGKYMAVLSREIRGKPFEREKPAHQRSAGRALGALHTRTARYHPIGTSWPRARGSSPARQHAGMALSAKGASCAALQSRHQTSQPQSASSKGTGVNGCP